MRMEIMDQKNDEVPVLGEQNYVVAYDTEHQFSSQDQFKVTTREHRKTNFTIEQAAWCFDLECLSRNKYNHHHHRNE